MTEHNSFLDQIGSNNNPNRKGSNFDIGREIEIKTHFGVSTEEPRETVLKIKDFHIFG